MQDIAFAFRTFKRAPLAALTIVVTVALGLGLVAVVFSILSVFLFRVDEVVQPGELFAVERPQTVNGERVRLTRPQFEELRRETSVFTDAFAMVQSIDGRIEGRMMAGTVVTGNFFQVLGVNAARGRTLTPEDDERLNGRPVMVLSEEGWVRHFDSDPTVVGRTLQVNGFSYEVVGIMPPGFRGLTVGAPDYWAPLSLLSQLRRATPGRDETVGLEVVGRLKPGMSRDRALAGLIVWDSASNGSTSVDRRAPNITLEPRRGTIPQPLEALLIFAPLFFAFGLILLIGCANVANLLLARAVSRQREIGIRLSLGASRLRIVRQLLTESLLLAFAAAALGFVISRVVLRGTISMVLGTMAPELTETIRLGVPPVDWRVALFLIGGAVVSTVFFGLVPALQATRLELVRTMRGEVSRDARPGRSRNVLIGIQVTASTLLLICSAVFLRSAFASSTADPGMRTSDTVMIEVLNESTRSAMIETVASDPSVTAIAASAPDVLSRPRIAFAEADIKSTVAYQFVSPEFFNVFGIEIVRGRGFEPAEQTPTAGVSVVSESAARELWPNRDPIGQVVQIDTDPNSESRRADELPLSVRRFTVVGIARDVPGFRIAGFKPVRVYVPANTGMAKTTLTARVQGNPEDVRRSLLKRLTPIDPSMGQVVTMRALARMETYFLQLAFWLTMVLGGLALALTLSGLFSVLSYLVEQRSKEIGVRMALGATAQNVARLVLAQSIRPVGVGLIIGGGLVAALATALMATPIAAQIGEIVHVFDPVAYAAGVIVIIAACVLAGSIPALRAARIDPITTLRRD